MTVVNGCQSLLTLYDNRASLTDSLRLLVKVAGHSYYQTLRDKLRWGTGLGFRPEPPTGGRRNND